jgi:hypothetical protein
MIDPELNKPLNPNSQLSMLLEIERLEQQIALAQLRVQELEAALPHV